jgi:hypothetical protein
VVEQTSDVAQVRPDGVVGEATLRAEVSLVVAEERGVDLRKLYIRGPVLGFRVRTNAHLSQDRRQTRSQVRAAPGASCQPSGNRSASPRASSRDSAVPAVFGCRQADLAMSSCDEGLLTESEYADRRQRIIDSI